MNRFSKLSESGAFGGQFVLINSKNDVRLGVYRTTGKDHTALVELYDDQRMVVVTDVRDADHSDREKLRDIYPDQYSKVSHVGTYEREYEVSNENVKEV